MEKCSLNKSFSCQISSCHLFNRNVGEVLVLSFLLQRLACILTVSF